MFQDILKHTFQPNKVIRIDLQSNLLWPTSNTNRLKNYD